MKKHEAYLRSDFFDTELIRAVDGVENGKNLIITYIALMFYTDEEGFISEVDVPEIADDLGMSYDELTENIDGLIDENLADSLPGGEILLTPQEYL